jgi:hypothetical protein
MWRIQLVQDEGANHNDGYDDDDKYDHHKDDFDNDDDNNSNLTISHFP